MILLRAHKKLTPRRREAKDAKKFARKDAKNAKLSMLSLAFFASLHEVFLGRIRRQIHDPVAAVFAAGDADGEERHGRLLCLAHAAARP